MLPKINLFLKKGGNLVAQAENTEPKKRTGAVKKSPSGDNKKAQPNAVTRYLRETRGEMRKVTWPTNEEAWRLTGIVLAFTLVFSLFLGSLDWIWSTMVEWIVRFMIGQI